MTEPFDGGCSSTASHSAGSVVRLHACYVWSMNAVRGKVRDGRIELDSALPEGADVVVLAVGRDQPFELDDVHVSELEARMQSVERGDAEPAASVVASLRRSR